MSKIIAGNWKMCLNSKDSLEFLQSLAARISNIERTDLIICPSFLVLSQIKSIIHNSLPTIHLGAQNSFWENFGAYTGEISPQDLKAIGCEYVILGHSERRRHFQETDEMINKKVKSVLAVGLAPIFCLGETKEERQSGKVEEVIKNQLKKGLSGIVLNQDQKLVIAYEPVWAIGTGEACDSDEAVRVHKLIKKEISKILPDHNLPVLYGGSVDDKNVASYVKNQEINGVLVGKASIKLDIFINLINNVKNI